jgi:hypothetical protein
MQVRTVSDDMVRSFAGIAEDVELSVVSFKYNGILDCHVFFLLFEENNITRSLG